jgi:hypothetical protein
MTLRKLWVLIQALPADGPLWVAVANDRIAAEAKAESDSIDETLNMMRR